MKKTSFFILLFSVYSRLLFAAPFLRIDDTTLGAIPKGIIVGEFNNDSKKDAFVSLFDQDKIEQLYLNSDGFFKVLEGSATHAVLSPIGFAKGDFNNDGHLDLGVIGKTGLAGHLKILLWASQNNGLINFNLGNTIVSPNDPNFLIFADLNGDHNLDLIIDDIGFSYEGGDGTGTFLTGGVSYMVDDIFDAVLTDLNSDNKPDLVYINRTLYTGESNILGVLFGNTTGPFRYASEADVLKFPLPGTNQTKLKSADLDGDGDQDFVIANHDSDNLIIALNNGTGTAFPMTTLSVCNGPYNLALADFNADTKIDIAVICDADGTADQGVLQVYTGKGDGTFDATPLYTKNLGTNPFDIVTDDFNADGHADLLISVSGSNKIVTLLGNNEPRLSSASYDFASNKLSVTYKDDDNEVPQFVRVSIDDATAVDLTAADSTIDYKNGKVYTLTQNLSEGSHRVKFSANDGTYDAKSADETITPVAAVGSITVTAPASSSGGCSLSVASGQISVVSWFASLLVLGALWILRQKIRFRF